jgi:type II secretory pathway component PulF
MIAGYIGGSDKLDEMLCRFARAYADQVERDHGRLVTAVRRGLVPAAVA